MLSHKLQTLFQTFEPYDWQGFKKFIASPFVNENESIISLFEMIHATNQSISGSSVHELPLSKEETWKKLFGSQPYDDVKIRRLASDLTQHILDYLAFKEFKKDAVSNQVFRLKAINKPSLTKHFRGVLRKTRHLLEKGGDQDADFFLNQHFIERQCHELLEQSEDKKNDLSNLKSADYFLDCFYITSKLKNYCDTLGYRIMLSLDVDLPLMPGFLDYISSTPYIKEPIIQAYYLVIEMNISDSQDKDQYYFKLKEHLNTCSEKINKKELKTLYYYVMNYCIYVKINNGVESFYWELFDVYKNMLKEGIIFEKEILHPYHYKNIIVIGLHLKELNWVEDFIREYTEYLPKPDQENALTYNLAELHFHKKEYSKVLELLREVEYQDVVYALGSKVLLLRTYYESGEWLALDSLLESFRIYLRRNKVISKEKKSQYLNFLKYLKKIVQVNPNNQKSCEAIQSQIKQNSKVAMKKWLLEKLRDLLN